MNYRVFRVSQRKKRPLLDFILSSLCTCGCRILNHSSPSFAPFRISFETSDGERMGIIAYAFLANCRQTRNRPHDEHRFQVKYGPKTGEVHEIWQDPYGLYTTIFLGINPEQGFFVGADPTLHSPTRFFISMEFKEQSVDEIRRQGWASWERVKRDTKGLEMPVEIMVGGIPEQFLRFVRFERASKGLDTGHRALLADKVDQIGRWVPTGHEGRRRLVKSTDILHSLTREFALSEEEILDLIESAPRLKMAVRGWVAEEHLYRQLSRVPRIVACERLEEEGQPDLRVRLDHGRPLSIECKNVLRRATGHGEMRLDFQRTRAAKSDPCSRYYSTDDFDVVAACLHPRTESWDFSFTVPQILDPHDKCAGKLSNRVRIDQRWSSDPVQILELALERA